MLATRSLPRLCRLSGVTDRRRSLTSLLQSSYRFQKFSSTSLGGEERSQRGLDKVHIALLSALFVNGGLIYYYYKQWDEPSSSETKLPQQRRIDLPQAVAVWRPAAAQYSHEQMQIHRECLRDVQRIALKDWPKSNLKDQSAIREHLLSFLRVHSRVSSRQSEDTPDSVLDAQYHVLLSLPASRAEAKAAGADVRDIDAVLNVWHERFLPRCQRVVDLVKLVDLSSLTALEMVELNFQVAIELQKAVTLDVAQ